MFPKREYIDKESSIANLRQFCRPQNRKTFKQSTSCFMILLKKIGTFSTQFSHKDPASGSWQLGSNTWCFLLFSKLSFDQQIRGSLVSSGSSFTKIRGFVVFSDQDPFWSCGSSPRPGRSCGRVAGSRVPSCARTASGADGTLPRNDSFQRCSIYSTWTRIRRAERNLFEMNACSPNTYEESF